MLTVIRSVGSAFLFVLALSLSARGAAADPDPELQNQLQAIRQSNGVDYEHAAKLTDPLLQKYAQDKHALAQIYLLRADLAFGKAPWAARYAEAKALLPLLPEDATDDINLCEDRLLESVGHGTNDPALFAAAYDRRLKRGGTSEKDRYYVLRAHAHAFEAYMYVWIKPVDWVASCKAMLASCDFRMKDHTNLVYPRIESLLQLRERVKPEEAYAIVQMVRPHLREESGKPWAPRILPHAAELEEQLGKPEAMLQTAEEMIALNPGDASCRLIKARAYRALKKIPEAEAAAKEVILQVPDTLHALNARVFLAETAAELGNSDEAFGRARFAFDVAPNQQEVARAIQTICQIMTTRDGHVTNANRFLLFQKYGQAGPDGKIGTEDDLPPFLNELKRAIDPGFSAKLTAEAEKQIDPLDAMALRRRGMFYIHAGKPEHALESFQREYSLVSASADAASNAVNDIAMALRAVSGRVFTAKNFLEYQQYGPAGADGKPGTADDLSFAFAAQTPIGEDMVKQEENAFHQELERNWSAQSTVEKGLRYASALSLAARPEEALSVAKGLYNAARDDQALNAACLGLASALRARDRNLVNANRFLSFQRFGPNGPDGIRGNDDDLSDPLAGFEMKLPQTHREWLLAKAEEFVKARQYQKASYPYLHLGDARQALSVLKRARGLCPFDSAAISELSRDVVTALKALNGHVFGSEVFTDYMQYGPTGKDGKQGTPDDLVDPLVGF